MPPITFPPRHQKSSAEKKTALQDRPLPDSDSRLKQSRKNAPPIIFVYLIVFELYQHWSICKNYIAYNFEYFFQSTYCIHPRHHRCDDHTQIQLRCSHESSSLWSSPFPAVLITQIWSLPTRPSPALMITRWSTFIAHTNHHHCAHRTTDSGCGR